MSFFKGNNFYLCLISITILSWCVGGIADEKNKQPQGEMKRSCVSTLPEARAIFAKDRNNLAALQTIADCTSESSNQYASDAKEIFEKSQILSVVPHLLEIAQIKELIPILKEVEVKKDKSINDYLMLNEIYEKLGDPEKQFQTLKAAITASPNDPRPLLLLAAKKLNLGLKEEAFDLFTSYVKNSPPHPGQIYLTAYVLALINPFLTAILLLSFIWFFAYRILVVQQQGARETLDMRLGLGTMLFVIPLLLAFRFWQTSAAIPFGALVIILLVEVLTLGKKYWTVLINPIKKFLYQFFHFMVHGVLLAKKLDQLSSGLRVVIALLAMCVLGTIAPTIKIPDLRYGVTAFFAFLFYATLGSLLVSFIRSRQSLTSSLRWIAIAATLPFLISYLISNWSALGEPLLFARWPSESSVNSFFNYLLFWGVSLILSLHLGRIVGEALLQPIREIMSKVARIEKGDWKAQVQIYSQDEIGKLGHAINRMRLGLERREVIEKSFHKYIDKNIAERILAGGASEFRIEGTATQAVVLFADIRGYTRLSESKEAHEVVHLLNAYFEKMVRIVKNHGGVVDKFIGDNLMAVWGVPHPTENAELKAVTAATEMIQEIELWSRELVQQGFPSLGIGVGINSGKVIAGSLGCTEHLEYTVIGDAVNTAQRAEAQAQKQEILITESVYEIVKTHIEARSLEPVRVKGKEQLQKYWAVEKLSETPSQISRAS